jgi:hypothetical protein
VGLNIDTTIALRTPGQLANLVNAILAADPVDETHWLEWKTDVNLTDRQWQARIAKFVLGVANRRPQVADPACEGCAYMALGVAPGKLSVACCLTPRSSMMDFAASSAPTGHSIPSTASSSQERRSSWSQSSERHPADVHT